ncbi:ribonuclease domain-containing protein [Lachnoanaerobaculum gingivalis]|uniref:ribonuclease domain-containing protein n=1 Tax=Lachnoanaerobaculum gingivalis TaxID=2490855 RepID=UPI0028D0118B|nr:ribonuclease domain-containing protein [Lachnoanaerobaculum gingivalis]
MTKKKKDGGSLLRKLLWWLPIIILGLMFALGACTRQEAKKESAKTESAKIESSKTESVKDGKNKSKDSTSKEEETTTITESEEETIQESATEKEVQVEENGNYTSKEEVALYIHTYGKLPVNYITKKEAQDMGWDPSKGNLSDILPGMSIGGSAFGNYEGALPRANGRRYFECDIDYDGGYRGAKRLVYSNDGLVFYTEDHYNTFEQIY